MWGQAQSRSFTSIPWERTVKVTDRRRAGVKHLMATPSGSAAPSLPHVRTPHMVPQRLLGRWEGWLGLCLLFPHST